MAPLRLLASVLAAAALAASVPISKDENTFGYGVQNTTYDSEQSVCVVDDVLYRAGDSLASANACERCVCQPPDFVCSPMACPMSPGCRAVQRSGQCCPDYHCECELNGQIYQNGEKVQAAERPCHVCYCRGGYVVCAALECYRRLDCAPRYEPGACCPKYDHCPPLENINRKRPQFPPPTVAGDTDNHIHRTLLLDEDQQLDSTNTDERILRLGEVLGATGKSNIDEIDLPQSDEAVKSEEREVPAITENSANIEPVMQKEVTSHKISEVATESNTFEMMQTPNYSREVIKEVITDEIQSTSRTTAEIAGSTAVTIQPNLETIDGNNEDVKDKTTMKLLKIDTAADSEKVTQQFRTDMSENNGSHTTEFQNDLDVSGATERNTLTETNLLLKKSDQEIENEGHLPTDTSFQADENLTEDSSNGQDIPITSTVESVTEGKAVNLEFQENIVTTTFQPDNDTASVNFDIEQRANEEITEASNNVPNDLVTEEIEQTSEHYYTTQDINSDGYTKESVVHHISNSHDLDTGARQKQTVDKNQFETNSSSASYKEEKSSSASYKEEKSSIIENDKAETQRTSPIITNIRVTDDDEFDGGIITDDDEESTDDNRPPITTDRIIYTYDKNDSSKPTTIEAFAVTDKASVFDEKVSTTAYEKESSQTTTEMPSEITTGRIVNKKDNVPVSFKSDDQHSATTEYEELTLSTDVTTLEAITEETVLLSHIHDDTINASSIINATKPSEVFMKIPDRNANDSEVNENSSGSSKLILKETNKKSDGDNTDSLPKSGSSDVDYDKSNETAEHLEVKTPNPTNVQSGTHLSETDVSDTFIREEPPVLLFKDEMAIHQMDVVVAEDEEASSTKEDQTEEVTNVSPPSKMDNVTNDTIPSVRTISTQTDDAETKKLLEKGYMTGFLNDQSRLPQKQHNVSAEESDDVLNTESTIQEESTFNTDSIDLTTTEDVSILDSTRMPEEKNSALQVADNSLLNAEHLKTITEITTEDTENDPTSEQPIITEKVTVQPKNDVATTMISNYNATSVHHQSSSHDSDLKAVTRNSSPSDETAKILPEVVSFRHNESLSGNEQNISESRQEITTPETATLPESWLKSAEKTTEEENTTILRTTDITDSTQELTDATTLKDFSNSATEYFVTTENIQNLMNHNTESSDNGADGVHLPGSEDEGPAQTIKKRNFRSEDSENLDKHDLLVLQEFFRKLYHH